jgi:hypothetical protein
VLVEIKKSFVFSGWHVEQPENVLAKACPDVEMLEDSGLNREAGWLRLYHCPAGELGMEAGADLHGSVGTS